MLARRTGAAPRRAAAGRSAGPAAPAPRRCPPGPGGTVSRTGPVVEQGLIRAARARACQTGKFMSLRMSSRRTSYSRFSSSRITWSAGNRRSRSSGRPYSTRRRRAARTTSSSLVRASSHGPQPLGRLGRLPTPEQHVHERDELLELVRAHRGAVVQVAEQPRGPAAARLPSLCPGGPGDGQVRQGPEEVGAAGLLEHLLQGADGVVRDGKAHQVARQRRVLAKVARHGEHRLGGPERGVETAQGDFGTEAHLESLGQGLGAAARRGAARRPPRPSPSGGSASRVRRAGPPSRPGSAREPRRTSALPARGGPQAAWPAASRDVRTVSLSKKNFCCSMKHFK